MKSLIKLAKRAVDSYIKKGEIIKPPEDIEKEFLSKRSGVFVTIEKKGELRGCIGTYLPIRENIAQETIHNAIAAASEDYRFAAIQPSELDELSYTVYLLGKPELVQGEEDLDPQKYGIIIKSLDNPGKSGLLLPGLESVETVVKQVAIASQKAGLRPEEKKIIYRFQVKKYGPEKE
jgi:AmmeMemoRadiSam system protein A